MGIVKEFREFAVKGNAIDMAVGIVIGGAFGKIVSSLVGDVIMPPVGKLLGAVNFADLYVNLGGGAFPSLAEARKAGAPTLNYGQFIQTLIDFTIVAAAIFMMVKAINLLRRREEAPPPPPPPAVTPEDVKLLREIRDLLKGAKA